MTDVPGTGAGSDLASATVRARGVHDRPALAVPSTPAADGLPLGVQLIGRQDPTGTSSSSGGGMSGSWTGGGTIRHRLSPALGFGTTTTESIDATG
jgi:hypothetical protein